MLAIQFSKRKCQTVLAVTTSYSVSLHQGNQSALDSYVTVLRCPTPIWSLSKWYHFMSVLLSLGLGA